MTQQASNIQKIEDAISLLYETYIVDSNAAAKRGEAIRAMDVMIQMLGGKSAVEKIERVPYSARLRAQGKELNDGNK